MEEKKKLNKLLTVSEIAENAGVSRNKVWSYLRKNKIKPVKKEKNIYYFDNKIVSKIEKKHKKKQEKNRGVQSENIVSKNVLEILEKQLEDKQRTIEKQQETIDYFKSENLALRLENSKKQKLLEDNQRKQEAISENDLETEKKQGFWSRLFGK